MEKHHVKIKMKLALFAVFTVGVAMQSSACFARYLGDLVGDIIWLRGID